MLLLCQAHHTHTHAHIHVQYTHTHTHTHAHIFSYLCHFCIRFSYVLRWNYWPGSLGLALGLSWQDLALRNGALALEAVALLTSLTSAYTNVDRLCAIFLYNILWCIVAVTSARWQYRKWSIAAVGLSCCCSVNAAAAAAAYLISADATCQLSDIQGPTLTFTGQITTPGRRHVTLTQNLTTTTTADDRLCVPHWHMATIHLSARVCVCVCARACACVCVLYYYYYYY